MSDSKYLELWRRMDRVVVRWTKAGHLEDADYCMMEFFLYFHDMEELEGHVRIAEAAIVEGLGPEPEPEPEQGRT